MLLTSGDVLGCTCLRTSVFLILSVRPKRLAARAKQSVIVCASSSECAARAQSSAYRRSCASSSVILDLAASRRRLKIPPSVCNGRRCLGHCCGRHPEAWLHRMLKSGAKTQPCLVPFRTVNGSDTHIDHSESHAIMERFDDADKLVRTAVFSQSQKFPRGIATDSVKRFCQINEYRVRVFLLFATYIMHKN